MRAPIGIRISSRRKTLRISQAELARRAGISASYLNLIEANKREVGGTLLRRIAGELDIDVGELTGESEHRLIHEIEEAFADPVLADAGLGAAEARDLVAQNPAVAQAIVRLYRAYWAATASSEAYANRLRADPLLSELLHQVLSGITAVRSSAEILEEVADLEEAERGRFVSAIGRETRGLTAVARNLIGQFDQASEGGRSALPRRELDDLIFASDNYFPRLEAAAETMRAELDALGPFGETTLIEALDKQFGVGVRQGRAGDRDALGWPGQHGYDPATRTVWFRNTTTLATRQFQLTRLYCQMADPAAIDAEIASPILTSAAARTLAHRALSSYLAGAVVFPYSAFLSEAEALRYDIDALRETYRASVEQVAHRLVTLRKPGESGVPFGFLRSDPAGRLTKHFPLPGLLLPSSGHACPLWAIYAAFRAPDTFVRQVVQFSGGARYLFIARTVSRRIAGFTDQTLPISVMLACDVLHADRTVYGAGLDLADHRADVPVGPACRLCTRAECSSRQEEPLAPGGEGIFA
ncbi:helix-turn-helix domain-containing protein [Devosia nitrariae]|uniref:XRE family transcriptional regulator n=1 Tax=Devosia nitrariae TaxID=2071872 RepID=A0ABQ5W4I9_9HYPH|nr:helix-turn-helix domain-containing protein [Devosia nitrariae]GLQ54831.1 XRE family transcriptional regulator [Devosia nitrariae]